MIQNKNWSPFSIKDLFQNIESTKGKTTGELIIGDDVPYIAAAKTNNGYAYMCSAKEHPEWVSKGNAIVFVQLGDGAAGWAHYVPMDFIGMNGKTSCGYNSDITRNNGIFIAKCLCSNKVIFSHGHSWTGQRLLNSKAMLPALDSSTPDYDFMNKFVIIHREKMLKKYRAYAEKQISEIEYRVIPSLYEKEWRNFLIPNIFDKIKRGKRLKNADHVSGMIPYVSSTAENNGVDDYIYATKGTRVFNNCISLANSGSVGTAFFEPFDFVASDHVTSLKNENFSKYTYLFLICILEKQKSNFNFNREINDPRIRKMQIMLPINENNEPDFEYMEQYAKNMMSKKYRQYLTFLDNERNIKR